VSEILPPRRAWIVGRDDEPVEAWLIFNGARHAWVTFEVTDGWERQLDGPVPANPRIEPDQVYETREAADLAARARLQWTLEWLEGEGASQTAERIAELRRRLGTGP
jgi:hypothetical protein